MRWFPAFNYIEARMAQAHLFDPLTESFAKFKQTPNEENLGSRLPKFWIVCTSHIIYL